MVAPPVLITAACRASRGAGCPGPNRLLAVALYLAGRQTDALDVIDTLAGRLGDELGLDPDPRTDELRTALLRHDVAAVGRSVGIEVATQGDELPPARHTEAASGARAPRPGPRPLPRPRTTFVGRDEERAQLGKALADARLVTLVGPGGTGKTRLAIEVVAALEPAPRDGVAFVDLAPLSDPAAVVAEVAASVGVEAPDGTGGPAGRASGDRTLAERLRDRLRHAGMLLVIDNCEHVIDAAAAAVERALDAGPDVRVLTTSREALRVEGEQLWPVPPLRTPAEDVPASAAAVPVEETGTPAPDGPAVGPAEGPAGDPVDLLSYDAARLFVQRARAADPSFRLDASTAPAIAQLCRRLDGLPLGIELAAARVATLPVTTLAERLDDRFRLLTGGRRTGRRQETLAAVVAWSYDLLDGLQQRVFRRLGVFSGEVGSDLVEAVLAGPDVAASDVLPTLTDLADRSLVVLAEGDEGPRVRMLETIRAYAHERLVADDDVAALRTRHAQVMSERAASAAPGIRGDEQLVWFRRLDDEKIRWRLVPICVGRRRNTAQLDGYGDLLHPAVVGSIRHQCRGCLMNEKCSCGDARDDQCPDVSSMIGTS
jgi:predicted ATPase